MSTSNPYAAKKERPEVVDSQKAEEPTSNVPAGTVNEILEWVGDDKERASEALEAEKAGAGRKTLVSALEDLLSEDSEDE